MKALFHSYFQFAIPLAIRNSERLTNLIQIFPHSCFVKPSVELKMFMREFREGVLNSPLFSSLNKEVSAFRVYMAKKIFSYLSAFL